jgi:predicted aldo/keto reductase-like oxidoreductase
MTESDKNITRRKFIERGVATVVGAGVGLVAAEGIVTGGGRAFSQEPQSAKPGDSHQEKPQIKDYRPLGRTGWKVSDIAFGNAGMTDPALLEYAMERGINYVDTARQYYDMEVVIGKLFPQKRDKLFVTTKLEPELFTLSVTAAAITQAIDESIQRLNTDHIDACLVHSVGDPNLGDRKRIENPAIPEAFEKAKKDGKIRAWGASSHGPKMIEDFTWLMENTPIDVIMPGMNYMTRGLEPVLAKAKEKGVAVVAMKSLSAARKIDYSAYMKEGRTVRQALLKWLLAQPNIDTISLTMRTFDDVDEFVGDSGNPNLSPDEKKTLEQYGMLLDRDYCRPGCDACLGACPKGVPIHDVLRYRLYFHSYGREKYAMGLYAGLPGSRKADQCASCPGHCDGCCAFGVPVRDKLIEANKELMA